MPYIPKSAREDIDPALEPILRKAALFSAGELNYTITRIIRAFFTSNNLKYTGIAIVTGVLENVKAEFYRRAAVLYEDSKMKEHGDVYTEET